MKHALSILTLAALLAVAGCGGQKTESASAEAGKTPAADQHPAVTNAAPAKSPEQLRMAADSTATRLDFKYRTKHDPNQVFTFADVPERGAYVKLNFEGLDDATVNRVLHRFMTEPATCDGCDGLTLDEVLSNLPDCPHCINQARAILDEARGGK